MNKETITRIDGALEKFEASLAQAGDLAQLRAKKLLTENEAVSLGYFKSSQAARDLRRYSKGPSFHKPNGSSVRYKIEDLEAWIESGLIRTTHTEGLG